MSHIWHVLLYLYNVLQYCSTCTVYVCTGYYIARNRGRPEMASLFKSRVSHHHRMNKKYLIFILRSSLIVTFDHPLLKKWHHYVLELDTRQPVSDKAHVKLFLLVPRWFFSLTFTYISKLTVLSQSAQSASVFQWSKNWLLLPTTSSWITITYVRTIQLLK